MKVCILSMQRVLNYGSMLQAYSLKKMIEELGHEVHFIDIESNEDENKLIRFGKEYEEGLQASKRSVLYRFLQQDSNMLFALPKILSKKKTDQKQKEFAERYLKLNELDNNQKYDVCVIGSDEVFNFMNTTSWGFTSQLFGNVTQANRVITYAASCGFSTYKDMSDDVKRVIRKAFSNIKAFSVRDKNTENFVKELVDVNPTISFDPVVVGNFDEEIASINKNLVLPKRYCIIYAYHGRINSENEIQSIMEFCEKKGLTPVSIGGYQKWIHKHLALSPFEVLYAFKNASFVITDTFHGTIFSAKYAERFAIIVRESNKNKLCDLVQKLGIESHLLADKKLEEVYELRNDFRRMNALVEKQRVLTKEYLERNI